MKKYLLFIVEGKNDKKEIQAMIRAACGSSFLDKFVDAYHIHNGDITSEKDSSEKNITAKLNSIVIDWRNGGEQPFQKIPVSDVSRIIHVIDTDGVFVPDYAIVETDDAKVIYEESSIRYNLRDQLVGRNRKKARVILKLLNVSQIDNIPYSIYFASCNMDHLLFNKRNPDPQNKGQNAAIFASKCKAKADLNESIYNADVCALGSFEESWNMIQKGCNSLARHTNLNLFLDSLYIRE